MTSSGDPSAEVLDGILLRIHGLSAMLLKPPLPMPNVGPLQAHGGKGETGCSTPWWST